jgi:serine protease AprX
MAINYKIAVLGAMFSSVTAFGGSKLSAELQAVDAGSTRRVIVQFDSSAMEAHKRVLARHGLRPYSYLPLVGGSAAEMSGSQLQALADDASVVSVVPDHTVRATDFTGGLDYGWMTALDVANASTPYAYNGAGVGVAIIDSGVNAVDDLRTSYGASRVVYQESFVPGDATTADAYGHGTHVAGILAGNGNDSTGGRFYYTIRGIAPSVHIVSLRVLDQNGAGSDSAVIAAIQRAIQLKELYNLRIVNLSIGRNISDSYTADLLCQAVRKAWEAGLVVVVAAGNGGRDNSQNTSGYGTITAPGNSPYVITVGAMNTIATLSRTDDKIASYSSKGPTPIDHIVKPDLVAPGNQILSLRVTGSTLDREYRDNQVPVSLYSADASNTSAPNYFMLSGTSMAAPMVSGAAALLLQEKPWLTPDQVKAKLMKTARKSFPASSFSTDPVTGIQYVAQNDMFTVGAGYLDIGAAVNLQDEAPAVSAASPQAIYDAANNTVGIVNGTTVVWGSSAIWGTDAVWGDSVVWGSSIVWGSSVVWGSSTMEGFSVVWGSSVVWGAGGTSPDGTNIAIQGDM